jgi:hypothetical protein
LFTVNGTTSLDLHPSDISTGCKSALRFRDICIGYILENTPPSRRREIYGSYIYVGRCHLGEKILLEEREKGGKYERKRKKEER